MGTLARYPRRVVGRARVGRVVPPVHYSTVARVGDIHVPADNPAATVPCSDVDALWCVELSSPRPACPEGSNELLSHRAGCGIETYAIDDDAIVAAVEDEHAIIVESPRGRRIPRDIEWSPQWRTGFRRVDHPKPANTAATVPQPQHDPPARDEIRHERHVPFTVIARNGDARRLLKLPDPIAGGAIRADEVVRVPPYYAVPRWVTE